MTVEEQAGIAVGNLVSALVTALHVARIDKGVSETMLAMFERMNSAQLPEGPLRARLDQAVRTQRAVLNHLPG